MGIIHVSFKTRLAHTAGRYGEPRGAFWVCVSLDTCWHLSQCCSANVFIPNFEYVLLCGYIFLHFYIHTRFVSDVNIFWGGEQLGSW